MNQILQNGTIVLGSAQALDFSVKKIVNFVNFIKKTKIVKNTIDDFSYDAYFSIYNCELLVTFDGEHLNY